MKRKTFALVFPLIATLLFASQSYSGGPLSVRPAFNGVPDRWNLTVSIQGAPVGVVPYRVDLGNLGLLTNAQAVALTDSFFQAYENIPTTTIRFLNQGPILSLGTPGSPPAGEPVDVNSTNFAPYLNPSSPLGQNIIVFDADGSIFDAIFGPGTGVLGFAGTSFVFTNQPFFFEALAAYNGRFLDGNAANGELAVNSFRGVFTHETGHFVGLDHSQINGQIASQRFGGIRPPGFTDAQLFDLYAPFTETVYPFVFNAPAGSILAANGFPNSGFLVATLALDEMIATSNLYPGPSFLPTAGSPFGAISGTILNSDRTTPVSGVNVVARRMSQGPFPPPPGTLAYPPTGVPSTDANGVPLPPPAQAATDSLATVASVVSGKIGPGFATGPTITPGNGTYQINGLPPGNYLVSIESIDLAFVGGSRVGVFNPPLQLVIEEYYNGPTESDDPGVDNPRDLVPVTVVAGQVTGGINFILNRVPTTNETEPNNTLTQANPITPPMTVVGNINPATDSDVYSFSGNAGDVIALSVRAQRLTPPSTLNPVVDLLSSDGTVLATNDDTFGLDSFLQFRLPSTGSFFVRVRSFSGASSGPYQLDASFMNPLPLIPVAISVSPASQNFGDINVGSSADRSFTVQNTGGGTLTGSVSTTAPFSIVSGSSFSLSAGQSQDTSVRFSPTSTGAFAGNVNFSSNAGTPSRQVTGIGVVGLAGDSRTNPIAITSESFSETRSTVSYTSSSDDPVHSCTGTQGGHTIWYRFTPARAGTATISTAGSSYDTVLSIYAASTLSEIACNNDVPPNSTSRVQVSLAASTAYLIEVSAFSTGASGNLAFSLSFAPQTFTLTVSPAGVGSGIVTSSPTGINCGSTCSASFAAGTSITLTAAAAPTSVFAGWSNGGCSGADTCTMTLGADTTVTATFNLASFTLTVSLRGSALGTVTSSPQGINCGPMCSAAYTGGTSVALTATPGAQARFKGWGGACSGTATTCTLTMNGTLAVAATFAMVFTDDPLSPRETPIRAVHFTELLQAINTVKPGTNLSWASPAPTPGGQVLAIHVNTLRRAVNLPEIPPGAIIAAQDIKEIRDAIGRLEEP